MRSRLVPQRSWLPSAWAAHPAFAPLADALRVLADHTTWPDVGAYDALLEGALGEAGLPPLRCEVQPEKPRRRRRPPRLRAELYDARIVEAGRLPTRLCNGHDLFNVLVWSRFPRAKWALHRRQHSVLVGRLPESLHAGLPGARTAEQDALTGFDEGGVALLVAAPSVEGVTRGLAARDPAPLHGAVTEGRARALLFGHALYDHLVSTDARVWGAPVVLSVDVLPRTLGEALHAADEGLALRLADPHRFARPEGAGLLQEEALFGAF